MELIRGILSAPSFSGEASTEDNDFQDNPNVAVVTFTSKNIGPADAGRLVVVHFCGTNSKDHTGITATIGGISATVSDTQSAAGSFFSGFIYATVPTNTTANIIFTFGGGGLKCRSLGILVMRYVGYSSTPDGTTSAASPTSITTSDNGVIGAAIVVDTASTYVDWEAGVQEVNEWIGSFSRCSVAMDITDNIAPSKNIQYALGGGTNYAFHAGSFAPA